MCGIAGVHTRRRLPASLVKDWGRLLAPRGPDGVGFLHCAGTPVVATHWPGGASFAGTAFVHRRLAILDRSAAGAQPMASPDGRLHIVYNGEVYNHVELRRELEAAGHAFRSTSDTEVVLAAYAQWGPACVERFVGMFAFAILDHTAGSLFLARDQFGIKPLYYAHGDDGFAFASVPHALLDLPWVSRVADAERVHRYLTSANGITSFGDRTMFRDVRQLPPATHAWVDLHDGSLRIHAWAPRDRNEAHARASDGTPATVRAAFLEAVRLHLRSDVPVGAALSGGIDSSSIVCAMRHLGGPDLALRTVSYIADDPALSEEHHIDTVVASTKAQAVKVHPADLQADFDAMLLAHGEPCGGSSVYAQYVVFRAARQAGIPVMLDGQGADELLAGYVGLVGVQVGALARRGRLLRAWRLATQAAGRFGVPRRSILVRAARLSIPSPLYVLLRRARIVEDQWPPWLDRAWFRRRGVRDADLEHPRRWRDLRTALHTMVTTTSLPSLLRYEDRNSMAHGVESRVPFLSAPLVAVLHAQAPERLLSADGVSKLVFRDAMRGLVPDAILDRSDKVGFATTEREWMLQHAAWVEETLAADVPFLDRGRIWQTWRAMQAGAPYDPVVWRWVSLARWAALFRVRFE